MYNAIVSPARYRRQQALNVFIFENKKFDHAICTGKKVPDDVLGTVGLWFPKAHSARLERRSEYSTCKQKLEKCCKFTHNRVENIIRNLFCHYKSHDQTFCFRKLRSMIPFLPLQIQWSPQTVHFVNVVWQSFYTYKSHGQTFYFRKLRSMALAYLHVQLFQKHHFPFIS